MNPESERKDNEMSTVSTPLEGSDGPVRLARLLQAADQRRRQKLEPVMLRYTDSLLVSGGRSAETHAAADEVIAQAVIADAEYEKGVKDAIQHVASTGDR
jgi:hypothetical protein